MGRKTLIKKNKDMMKELIQKHFLAVLCTLLFLLLILSLFAPRGQRDSETEVRIFRDTVPGDPYPVEVPRYVPVVKRETVVTEIPVTLRDAADTAAILRDYFAVRFYSDTLRNDSSLLAVVNDSVAGNRIVGRQFTYQNRRPTAINTTIIQPARKEAFVKVYAGVFAGYSPRTTRAAVGPEVAFALRPGPMLRYGYDIAGNGHQVSFGWKLSFRR